MGIVYVGIDVDDDRYHSCVLNQHTSEVLDFRCRPTLKGLANLEGEDRRLNLN